MLVSRRVIWLQVRSCPIISKHGEWWLWSPYTPGTGASSHSCKLKARGGCMEILVGLKSHLTSNQCFCLFCLLSLDVQTQQKDSKNPRVHSVGNDWSMPSRFFSIWVGDNMRWCKRHAPSPPSFRSNNSVFKHLPLSPLPVFAPAAFKIQARDPTCLGIQHKPIFLWQTCRGSHQWWVALQTESKWPARPLGLYMCHFKDCYCGFPLQGDLETNDVEFVGWFHVVFRRHMRHPQKLWFVAGCEHSNLVLFTCDFGNFTFDTGLHLACP